MTRLLLALVIPLFFTQFVTAQSAREILRLGRGTANALDWRPDGEVLAVGSGTGIWLYDQSFETLAHLEDAETGNVETVKWSPAGDRIASANDDNLVKIWEIEDDGSGGNETVSIEDAGEEVVWSPDGNRLASTTWLANGARIFDAQTGELLLELPLARGEVAWSPDGTMLAGNERNSSDYDTAKLWDTTTGSVRLTLVGAVDDLFWSSFAWSPDGSMLVGASCLPSSIHVWQVSTGALVNTPDTSGDMYCLRQVLWNDQDNQLVILRSPVTPPAFSSMCILDVETLEEGNCMGFERSQIRQIAWQPQSKTLTSLSFNSEIMTWNAEMAEQSEPHNLHTAIQHLIAWSPDGNQLATSVRYGDGYPVMIWDVTSPEQIEYPSSTFVGYVIADLPWTFVTSLIWTDNNELVTTSDNEPINYVFHSAERWDADTGNSRGVFFRSEDSCGAYGLNSDFSRVACTDYDGTKIEVHRIESEEVLLTIPVDDSILNSIEWSPDDKTLAITTWNNNRNMGAVELRDSTTGELLNTYSNVNFPRWSPDSTKLALTVRTGDNSILRVVNVSSGESTTTTGGSFNSAWSPDSRLLAVATIDDLRFLDTDTGDIVETISITGIGGMAWSLDGTMLALGMSDGTIRIWDVSDITPQE